jgi:hypothetical protein
MRGPWSRVDVLIVAAERCRAADDLEAVAASLKLGS